MKSVINSYRLQPGPVQSPPTIAGRIVPVAAPTSYRRALVVLAALLLPLLAIGVVVYAARTVQPTPVSVPSPGVGERIVEATPAVIFRERVVEATPIVIVVTATPMPAPARVERPAQVAPVAPRAPVVNQPAPRPTARPTSPPPPSPVSGGPVRAAGVSAPVSASDSGPQERLLSRPCQFPDAPQGAIIRGYYTDTNGVKRDAICKPDGWKAAD